MKEFNVNEKRFPKFKDVKPEHTFVNDLENISVEIQSMPTVEDIAKYAPGFILSTWDKCGRHLDSSKDKQELAKVSKEDAIKLIYRALKGKFLPTFLESIKMTVLIDGLTMHSVTHLIRSRSFGFAAECTGDGLKNHKEITVPDAIIDAGMEERYKATMNECMKMYTDLLNTGKVAIQDARMMLPRTIGTFYYTTLDMGGLLRVTRQRIDEQVQPKEDNILWLKIWLEACKKIPFLSTIIDINAPNRFYCNETKTNFYSGFFEPNKNNQGQFEFEKGHFIHDCTRDELYGNATYNKLKAEIVKELEEIKVKAKEQYPYLYDAKYEEEYR